MNLDRIKSYQPEIGIVLGSGLNSFVDAVDVSERISYHDIPDFPCSTVPGHAGQFALAGLSGKRLIIAQGRVHLYEGRSAREVTAGVRLMAECGVKTIILTNAAGSLNPAFHPGSWMALNDHLNLTGQSPLTGGPNFVDLTEVYSKTLREIFGSSASRLGVDLHEGVYASLPGPQYETPAEIRMLRTLGADAVGMSTVLEAIQARALGLQVGAFSCLTNWGAGLSSDPLSHAEVMETGLGAAQNLVQILSDSLPAITG